MKNSPVFVAIGLIFLISPMFVAAQAIPQSATLLSDLEQLVAALTRELEALFGAPRLNTNIAMLAATSSSSTANAPGTLASANRTESTSSQTTASTTTQGPEVSSSLSFSPATSSSPDPQIARECQVESTGWICPIVNEVDPITFSFLYAPDGSSPNLAKDNNHVYALYTDGPAVLSGADPASFQVISSYPWWWVKDKYHVWFDLELVDSADPTTFVVLPYGQYAKDSKHVFYAGGIISGADPASFSFYADGVFARDQSHVYSDGTALSGVDLSTFLYVGSGYGKDQQHVWYGSYMIVGADPSTFEIVNDPTHTIDARDKNHTYQGGSIVS